MPDCEMLYGLKIWGGVEALVIWIEKFAPLWSEYSNLPNNRVGPFNRVGGRFLRN